MDVTVDNWEAAREDLTSLVLKLADSKTHNWVSRGVKDGVTTHMTPMPESNVHLLRARAQLSAPVTDCIRYVKGLEHCAEFDPMFDPSASKTVENLSQSANIYYGVWKLPWPLYSRDFLWFESTSLLDDGTGVIALRSVVRDTHPPVPQYVRGNIISAAWIFSPVGDSKCDATYLVQVDSKGWLPKWLINLVATDQALNVFRVRQHFDRVL